MVRITPPPQLEGHKSSYTNLHCGLKPRVCCYTLRSISFVCAVLQSAGSIIVYKSCIFSIRVLFSAVVIKVLSCLLKKLYAIQLLLAASYSVLGTMELSRW